MTSMGDLERRIERLEDGSGGDDDRPETFAEAIKQAVLEAEEEDDT